MNSKIKNYSMDFDYDYSCVSCGECCKIGYRVFVTKKDVKKWMQTNIDNIINNLFIYPYCISSESPHLSVLDVFFRYTIKKIREQNNKEKFDILLEELIDFIRDKHYFYRKSSIFFKISPFLFF